MSDRASPDTVDLAVDGTTVAATVGSTVLDVLRALGIDTPALCRHDTLTPANACRACVVEVEGSRALVASCSRVVEPGMAIRTDTERVRHSRRMVLELLSSATDLSYGGPELARWIARSGARADRYGAARATAAQPVKVDNELYVRDYARCILCYRCVEACGADAQNTFAIAVAGRGFEARISTEYDVPLPDSACVYCGNCVAVCPTGALMPKTEHDLRAEGGWHEDAQTVTRTVCGYCGVGCELDLHVQDGRIVKVTSPSDGDVTRGNLCIKGRYGFASVGPDPADRDAKP